MGKLKTLRWLGDEIEKLFDIYVANFVNSESGQDERDTLAQYGVEYKVSCELYELLVNLKRAKEPSEIDLQIEKLKEQGEELSRQIEILEQERRQENE